MKRHGINMYYLHYDKGMLEYQEKIKSSGPAQLKWPYNRETTTLIFYTTHSLCSICSNNLVTYISPSAAPIDN
jgi:hypothetical protein